MNQLICGVCKQADRVVLVTQVYTPLDFDRSIYVFCCNTRACSLRSEGWIVLRNQASSGNKPVHKSNVKTTTSASTTKNNTKSSGSRFSSGGTNSAAIASVSFSSTSHCSNSNTTQKQVKKSLWDDFGADNYTSSSVFDFGTTDADLELLLQQRDTTLTTATTVLSAANDASDATNTSTVDKQSGANTTMQQHETDPSDGIAYYPNTSMNSPSVNDVSMSSTSTNSSNTKQLLHTAQVLPCWELSDVEEPWYVHDNDNDEADSAFTYISATTTNSISRDAHINKLLQSYLACEEETSIVEMLRHNSTANYTKQPSDTSNNKSNTTNRTTTTTNKNSRTSTSANGDDDSDNDSQNLELKLSGDTATSRFCAIASHEPHQVLRYAYGGNPLWICYPDPLSALKNSFKASSSCGMSRDSKSDLNGVPSEAATDDWETAVNTKKSKKINKKHHNASNASTTTTITKIDATSKHSNTHISGSENASVRTEIPHCEWCGAARVFEFQLMPALLTYINTPISNTHTSSNGSIGTCTSTNVTSPNMKAPTGANHTDYQVWLQQTWGDELDFGVVAVWSCPNSCSLNTANSSASPSYCREVVLVQPPLDSM